MIGKEYLERLTGGNVVDEAGNKIGSVGQIYLDDQTGNPSWVTVKTGWFGSSETFVPLDNANIEGDDIRVPFSEAKVKDAPRIDVDQHLDVAQEEELYRYYGQDYTRTDYVDRDVVAGDRDVVVDRDTTVDRDVTVDRDRLATDRVDNEGVTLHEERLNVGTQQREAGRARLRKYTVEEQQTITVPVTRERVEVVREPLNERVDGDVIGRDQQAETEVVLHEEVPVINKETVAVERVGLQTTAETTQQQVTDTVRKEMVDTDGVQVEGGVRREGEFVDGDRSLGEKINDATDRNNDGKGMFGETTDAPRDIDGDGVRGK